MRRHRWSRALRLALLAAGSFVIGACGLSVVGTATTGGAAADASVADETGPAVDVDASTAVDAAAPEDAARDATTDGGVRVLRWNIGGPAYAGSATLPGPWAAGGSGVGPCMGSPFSTTDPIRNTTDDVLFQTELFGAPLACTVPGLAAGRYRVRLLFAEIYFGAGCAGGGGTGSRVFDIRLEGTTVLAGLDVHAVAGCAAGTVTTASPIARTFEVEVDDGALDISLQPTANNGKLSALEVTGPLP
jgi:hypothetical protein